MASKRIIGFATPAECKEIAAWALDPVNLALMIHRKNEGTRSDGVVNQMTAARTGTKHYQHLRLLKNAPPIIDILKNRIFDLITPTSLGDQLRTQNDVISRLAVHEPDTDVSVHSDAVGTDIAWRANILCQAPISGGLFIIGRDEEHVQVGELLVFNANGPHKVQTITAGIRVLLTFGWLVTKQR